jgi:DNA-binding response OmpR family regulator
MKASADKLSAQLLNREAVQPEAEICDFPITEPPRILIVEDDTQLADVISNMLSSIWFNCFIRRSGAQGIQAFMHDPVDLIITDLRMEAGDGVALIETIRRTSQVPVIIITGYAKEYADRVRFLDNVALLTKPFEWKVLVELVEKALDIRGTPEGWNLPPGNFEAVS